MIASITASALHQLSAFRQTRYHIKPRILHHHVNNHPTPNERLSNLPPEILVCIFSQLDSLQTIAAFGSTCQMMHAVASLPHSIASWLITTFGRRFAIYYAILALPTSCDGEFIRVLVNLGAIVPRYLVQALTSVFGKHLGRRRSSEDIFSLGVLDNLFYDAAQRLPFTGFAAIAYIASERYGNIQTSTPHGDLGTFLNHYLPTSAATDKDNNGDVGQTLLDQFGFMPAPLVTTPNEPPPSSLRVLLRLATTDPKTYQIIEPVFRFDPLARRYLWDVVLLFLFDLGFRATVDRPEDHASLNALKTVIRPTTSLVTSVEDQDLFCYAFVSLLRKYPVGYCDKQTMNRMLNLLKEHVYPGFSLKEALQSLTRREIRTDTKVAIEHFLNNNSNNSNKKSK